MSEFSIDQVMKALPDAFQADQAGNINAFVQFRFTGEQAADWGLHIQDGACTASPGSLDQPNVTMEVDSGDFLDMLSGRLEPMAAFMRGKLQLRGDVALAMKLPTLFKRP